MADFKIAFSNGKIETYAGDARYRFQKESGVLEVLNGQGRRFVYSPAAWLCVEDDEAKSAYEDHGLTVI